MDKSVYKYAAEAGLPVGIYLTAMSMCLLLSLRFPVLPVFVGPLALFFPFLLARLMKRMAVACPGYGKFSALWLFGIYTVIFGTLICSLVSGVYLTLIEPGFIGSYVTSAIATLEASPQASEYSDTVDLMRQALEARMLPTGMEFVSSMAWLTCFAGSMLSLVIAAIIGKTQSRKAADMWR